MARGFTTPGGIRFEPASDGDYEGASGGIKFSILKSTDAGFGISAQKNGAGIATRIGGIAWLRSRKRCAEHADSLLRAHGDA